MDNGDSLISADHQACRKQPRPRRSVQCDYYSIVIYRSSPATIHSLSAFHRLGLLKECPEATKRFDFLP